MLRVTLGEKICSFDKQAVGLTSMEQHNHSKLYRDSGLLPAIYSHNPLSGKYLGGHEEHNLEVLNHFVRCHEFSHLLLVQALRQFLWSFRWPPLNLHHLSLVLTLLVQASRGGNAD